LAASRTYAYTCSPKRMYAAMKSQSGSGERPLNSVITQFTKAAKNTAIPHSPSQISSGIARKIRKKTVQRFRPRSSVTVTRTGCSAMRGLSPAAWTV